MAGIDGLNNVQTKQDVQTPFADGNQQVSVESFLQLMIAQLKNQDFTNPVDDTQYVTQLAQFATMQQMQDLAYYSRTNYAMSLVGKDVTVASMALGGKVDKISGPVEKVALSDKELLVYVKGKGYKLSQIMTVDDPDAVAGGDANNAEKLAVVLTNRTQNTASIRWDAPSKEDSVNEKYTYSIYYSETDGDFDTVEKVKKGTLAGETDAETLNLEIKGLEPGKQYFVNVVVTAPDGTEKVYQKLSFNTQEA